MAWYDETNFYRLLLTNDALKLWQTPLTLGEAKAEIGIQSFIMLSNHDGSEENLNTKVIQSILDATQSEREMLRKQDESIAERLQIVQKIRTIPLSAFRQWFYGLSRKPPKEIGWFQKSIGTDLDPLMRYNERSLSVLLQKCLKHKLAL